MSINQHLARILPALPEVGEDKEGYQSLVPVKPIEGPQQGWYRVIEVPCGQVR